MNESNDEKKRKEKLHPDGQYELEPQASKVQTEECVKTKPIVL
jgi:hypothetical protein